jgi:hypothetical protein
MRLRWQAQPAKNKHTYLSRGKEVVSAETHYHWMLSQISRPSSFAVLVGSVGTRHILLSNIVNHTTVKCYDHPALFNRTAGGYRYSYRYFTYFTLLDCFLGNSVSRSQENRLRHMKRILPCNFTISYFLETLRATLNLRQPRLNRMRREGEWAAVHDCKQLEGDIGRKA